MGKKLNFLIKPVGGACNLKCKYCFYTSIVNTNKETQTKILNNEIQENQVRALRVLPVKVK